MTILRWEYISVRIMGPDQPLELNRLGAMGWELVAVTGETTTCYGAAILKRPLRCEDVKFGSSSPS